MTKHTKPPNPHRQQLLSQLHFLSKHLGIPRGLRTDEEWSMAITLALQKRLNAGKPMPPAYKPD